MWAFGLIAVPIMLGISAWAHCGAPNRDENTRCRNTRRGPLRRCGSHETKLVVRSDIIGLALCVLAAPGAYLWGTMHDGIVQDLKGRFDTIVDEFRDTEEKGEPATVEDVVSGDEFIATMDGKRVRVHLIGIDAPGAGDDGAAAECGGQRAVAGAYGLLSGESVGLSFDPSLGRRSDDGGLQAYVSVGGDDAGSELLKEGFARPVAGTYKRAADYRADATQARRDSNGLWGECGG